MVRHGELVSVRPGVVALMGAVESWEQRVLAAIMTPGTPVSASHRSALRIWNLWTRFDRIELAVRAPANRRLAGAVVHRSVDLCSRDLTMVNGIRVTTVARTLCDSGLVLGEREVRRLADHAISAGLVTIGELQAVRHRVGEHGRNGVVKLDLAVDSLPEGAADAESGPEVDVLRILTDAGLPVPARQHQVMAGGNRYRIDLAYPAVKLALEYDGRDAHTRFDRFAADRRRQNDLVCAGWTVLRYTHEDLRDRPWTIVRQVGRHLAA